MNTPTVSSAQILPSGNILLVQFDSPVASVGNANVTLTVGNRTITLPLATGMWRNNTTFLWFPLNFNYAAVIDDAVATKTGSWGSNPNTTGMFAGNAYAISAHGGGGDPSTYPSITYPFAGVAQGNYRVYINPTVWPDFTPDAKYIVKDGDTIDGVFHVNQKIKPTYDHLHRGLHYQLLGTVACSSGNLFVTLTDADATGYAMGSDAVLIERVQERTVPVGTAVTLDAPDGWVVTKAGPVAGLPGQPVTIETDATWFPFDPNAPRTLEKGYNLAFARYDWPSLVYANRYRIGGEWHNQGTGGAYALDGDGHLATLSGGATASLEFLTVVWNGRDLSGYPTAPRSGQWRLFYSYETAGPAPSVTVVPSTDLTFLIGPTTITSSATVGSRTHVWATCAMDTGPADVNHPGGACYNPAANLRVAGAPIGPDLLIFGPEIPADWTSLFHPSMFARLQGKGLKSLRFMDSGQTINSNVVEVDDFPTPQTQSTLGYRKQFGANVVSFDPVIFDGSDPDGLAALSYFGFEGDWAIVKVTTDTPHHVAFGSQVAFIGADAGGVWIDNGGGQINCQNSNYSVALSPTTFLCRMYTTGTSSPNGNAHPITLGSRVAPSLLSVVRAGQGMPPFDQVSLCNEVRVDLWFCLHHLMSDDAVTTLVTMIAKRLAVGLKCRLELSNEVWNTMFAQTYHFAVCSRRGQWLLDNGKPGGYHTIGAPWRGGFAHRFAEVMALARKAWAAQGRDPADLIRVLGSQRGYPAQTEWALQQFTSEGRGDTFDEVCIDTYQSNNSGYDEWYFGDIDEAKNARVFDALDLDSVVDAMKIHLNDGHLESQVAAHRALLAQYGYQGKPIVAYEGGFESFVPFGTNADDTHRRSQSAARQPRVRLLELSRSQANIQSVGLILENRYLLDGPNGNDKGNEWHDFTAISQRTGMGDGSDDLFDNRRNPHDLEHIVSVIGLATQQWGGTVAPPPPPPPDPSLPPKPGPPGLSRKRPPAKPRGGL